MSVKVLLHVHTKYSQDSIMPFWLLYKKCLNYNIEYIAITEHNNLDGANAFMRYCQRRGDKVRVIPGEEIMTTSGEIIGLYLHENIPKGLTPQETIKRIKNQGGIVYIPHPYDEKRWRTVLDEQYIASLCEMIDCIECHNGRNVKIEFSNQQEAIAKKYRLSSVIGADAHTAFELGRNYILFSIKPDKPNSFKLGIEKAKAVKHPCLNYCHVLTKYVKVIKFLQKGDLCGLCKAVYRKFKRKKLYFS